MVTLQARRRANDSQICENQGGEDQKLDEDRQLKLF